jgi:hypothetical protein
MDTDCETTKPDIRTSLAYRDGFLCAVAERGNQDGAHPTTLKLGTRFGMHKKPRYRRCWGVR